MGPPKWWQLCLSLIAATLCQIAAGSANLFSLYAPQLSERLGYSQTETATVAVSMNLGMYLSGVVVGHYVDKYRENPAPIFLMAAFLLSAGYALMSVVFSGALEVDFRGEPVSTHFVAYAGYAAIVGIGSCLCNQTSIAGNLRNFPPTWRGLAVGIPMAFYGLSALVFSQVAKYAFYDEADGLQPATLDVSSFLMFIGCVSGIICIFAALVLQDFTGTGGDIIAKDVDTASPYHHTHHHHSSSGHHTPPRDLAWTERSPLRGTSMIQPITTTLPSSSSSALVHNTRNSRPTSARPELFREGYTLPPPPQQQSLSNGNSLPTSYQGALVVGSSSAKYGGSSGATGSTYGSIDVRPRGPERTATIVVEEDLSNDEDVSCFVQLDAYLLAFIMFSLAGVGLMHINNVGAVILALAPPPAKPSSPAVQAAQSLHVSLISVFGFSSQAIVGAFADAAHRMFKLNRLIWMFLAALLLAAGSFWAAAWVDDLPSLVWVTALIGAGNGAAWSAAPMLVGDFFGQKRFATHFGWMTLSPAFGGQALSLIFGAVFDAAKTNPSMPDLRGDFEECRGLDCFVPSYWIATVLCCLSLGLTIILWVRRGKRISGLGGPVSRVGVLRRGFA
ncbi:hypothetical protein SmJEL517_g03230 [Synchytrium microbalum]|uniref:Uncharacterized protein n=1 Tax=Synchytrium microbalum TaxID=1806994 RepID=A0A507C4M5_9FUNG|nr:uncharacterized protein SmJEL517_g03230 [Synchytrium microbalum]TPX34059.1 hypothetical protein SmJEL517_g03230 [Synchytrium microbalum]